MSSRIIPGTGLPAGGLGPLSGESRPIETRRPTEAREVEAPRVDPAIAGRELAETEASLGATSTGEGRTRTPRERFRDEMRRYEALRSSDPVAAGRILRETLPPLARQIREGLRSSPRELLEDLRMLRGFHRAAREYEGAHVPTRYLFGDNAEYTAYEGRVRAITEDLNGVEAGMRALRDVLRARFYVPPGGHASADQLAEARFAAEISRELGEHAHLRDDLRTWSRLLANADSNAIPAEDLAAESVALLQGWSVLRDAALGRIDRGPHPAPLDMTDSEISTEMRRTGEMTAMFLSGDAELDPAMIRTHLDRWIDGDRPADIAALNLESLIEASETRGRLAELLTRAEATTDLAERRELLLNGLQAATGLGDSTEVSRVLRQLEQAMPAADTAGGDLTRLETLTQAYGILRGADSPAASRIREELESLGARFRDPSSGLSALDRARGMTLVRNFYLSVGDTEQANSFNRPMRELRDELRRELRGARETMAPLAYADASRTLAELSLSLTTIRDAEIGIREREIYDRMITEARGRGEDVSWSHQQRAIRERAREEAIRTYGEELSRDMAHWLVAAARLRRAEPAVELGTRMEHGRALAIAMHGLRGLEVDGNPLIAERTMANTIRLTEELIGAIFEDSLAQAEGPNLEERRELAGSIVADLNTRVHAAMAEGASPADLSWLSGLSPASVTEFAEISQSAHLLLRGHSDPPTERDLQASLQAAQLFASLGLPERVTAAMAPLETFAAGIDVSSEEGAGTRAQLLLSLAQVYSSAGMSESLRRALEGVVALDRPGELHGMAELARGMIHLSEGRLDEARSVFAALPEDPVAQSFLRSILDGERGARIARTIGVLRAVSANFLQRGRDAGEDMDAWERDTNAGWDEVQRLVLSGECSSIGEALGRVESSGRFPGFHTGAGDMTIGSRLGYFLSAVDNPALSDADFGSEIFEFAAGIGADGYLMADGMIYQMMAEDPRYHDEATERLEGLPGVARFQAGLNIGRMLLAMRAGPAGMLGISMTSGSSPDEVITNTAMVVVPFAAARAVAVGAEGLFVARATGGSIRAIRTAEAVERTYLAVEAGGRSVRGLRLAGFGVRAGTEAAVFTVSSMGLHSLFTGHTDNWTWGNFGREFGSMLLTFGLCHGIGMGMSRLGREAARVESLRTAGASAELGTAALRPGASRALGVLGYGATLGGLTGLEYFNEAIGLHPHEGDVPFLIRLFNSAMMDAQMRVAGSGIDAVSGGRISRLEASTHRAYDVAEVMPALHRLGFEGPNERGEMPAESRLILDTMLSRIAAGESASAVESSMDSAARTRFETAVRERIGLDPSSAEGRQLTALLYAHVYRPGRTPDGARAVLEHLPESLAAYRRSSSSFLREVGISSGPRFEAMRVAILAEALREGRSPSEVGELLTGSADFGGRVRSIVDGALGPNASTTAEGQALMAALTLRAIEGGNFDNIGGRYSALVDAMPAFETALGRGFEALGETSPGERRRIAATLLLRAAEEGGDNAGAIAHVAESFSSQAAGLRRATELLTAMLNFRGESARGELLAWAVAEGLTPGALEGIARRVEEGRITLSIRDGRVSMNEVPAESRTEFREAVAERFAAFQRHLLAQLPTLSRLLDAGASAPAFFQALSAEVEAGRLTLDAEIVERVSEIFSDTTTMRALDRVPHERRIEVRQALLYEILTGRITRVRGIGDRIYEIQTEPARFEGVRMGGGERPSLVRSEFLPRIGEGSEGYAVLERFDFAQGTDGPMVRRRTGGARLEVWTDARLALEQLADPGQPAGPLVNMARRTRGALEAAYESAREIETLSGRTPPPPELEAARSRLAEATRRLEAWERLEPVWRQALTEGEALVERGSRPFYSLRLALEPSAREVTRTDRELAPGEGSETVFEPGAALEGTGSSTNPMRAVAERILSVDSTTPDAAELADAWLDPTRGDQGRGPIRAGEIDLVVREGTDIASVADAAVARLGETEIFRGVDPASLRIERSTDSNGTVRLEFAHPEHPNLRFVVRVLEQRVARTERTEAEAAFERASRFEAEERPVPELRVTVEEPEAPPPGRETVRPPRREGPPEEGTRPGTPRRIAGAGTEEPPGEGTRPGTPRRMARPAPAEPEPTGTETVVESGVRRTSRGRSEASELEVTATGTDGELPLAALTGHLSESPPIPAETAFPRAVRSLLESRFAELLEAEEVAALRSYAETVERGETPSPEMTAAALEAYRYETTVTGADGRPAAGGILRMTSEPPAVGSLRRVEIVAVDPAAQTVTIRTSTGGERVLRGIVGGEMPFREGQVVEFIPPVAGAGGPPPPTTVLVLGSEVRSITPLRASDARDFSRSVTVNGGRLSPDGRSVELLVSRLEVRDGAARETHALLRMTRAEAESHGFRFDAWGGLRRAESPPALNMEFAPAETAHPPPVVVNHPDPAIGGTRRVEIAAPVDAEGNIYALSLASLTPASARGSRHMVGHPIRADFHPDGTAYVTFEGRVAGESAPRRFMLRMDAAQARAMEFGRSDRSARDFVIAYRGSTGVEPVRAEAGPPPPPPAGTVDFAGRSGEFSFGRETTGESADLTVGPEMRMVSRRQARFRTGAHGLEVHAEAAEGTWILHNGRWRELHASDGWFRLPEGARIAFGRPAEIDASGARRTAPPDRPTEHLIIMEVAGSRLRAASESGLRWTPRSEPVRTPAVAEPAVGSSLSGEDGIVLLNGTRYEIRIPESSRRGGGEITFPAFDGDRLEVVSTEGETVTFRARLRNIREAIAGRDERETVTFSMPRAEAIRRRLIDADGRVLAPSIYLEVPVRANPDALTRSGLPTRPDGSIDIAALPGVLGPGVADPAWRSHPEDRGGIAAGGTEGRGYGDHNEDRYLVFTTAEGRHVTVVIDGMGGHGGGERAASIARAVIGQALERGVPVDQALELAHSAMVQDNGERRSRSGAVACSVEVRPTGEGDFAVEMRRIGDSDAAAFDLSPSAEEPIVGRTERHSEGETREVRLTSSSAVDSAMGLTTRGPQEVTSLRMREGQVLLVGSDGFWENFIDYREVRDIMMRAPDHSAEGLRSTLMTEVNVRQRLLEMRGRASEPWVITPERYREAYRDVTGGEPPASPPWRYLGGTLARDGRVTDAAGRGIGRFKADNVTLVVEVVGDPVGGARPAPVESGEALAPEPVPLPMVARTETLPELMVVGVPGLERGRGGSNHPFLVSAPESREGLQVYRMTLDERRAPGHVPTRVEVRSATALEAPVLESILSPHHREAGAELSLVYGERIPLQDMANGGGSAPVIDFYAVADAEAAAAVRSPGHPSVAIADPSAAEGHPIFAMVRSGSGWRLNLQAEGISVVDAEGRPRPAVSGNPRAFDLAPGDRVRFGVSELIYDGRGFRSESTTEARVRIPAGEFH